MTALDRKAAEGLGAIDIHTLRACIETEYGRRKLAAEVINMAAEDLRREGAVAALRGFAAGFALDNDPTSKILAGRVGSDLMDRAHLIEHGEVDLDGTRIERGDPVTATASEALTVARRILDTHIRGAVNGVTITPDAAITIGVTDTEALARAGVALHLNHRADQWCGYVDDINVTLRLAIPSGVFPTRTRPGVAA